MPDRPPTPQPTSAPQPERSPERKPAIRTMESDVGELFKTTKPSLIKIIGEELARPGIRKEKKAERRIGPYLAAAAGIGGAIILGGLLWRFLAGGPEAPAPPPKLIPPAPFFATEAGRTITASASDRSGLLRLLEDSIREPEREGTFKRVIIKLQDGPQERFATFTDFLEIFRIKPPGGLLRSVESALMAFIHTGAGGPRFGLALRAPEADRALRNMILWESALPSALRPLLFGEEPDTALAPFEDRTYRNIDWRYLKLSQTKDLGIGYFIFPARNVLVITTGKESAERIIDRLFSQ